jgi:hypothetical protein
MLLLNSHITIDDVSFAAHDVRVSKSIHSFIDTATIKIPATARLVQSGVPASSSIPTAQKFGENDMVSIQLGYNGELKEEFKGFVKRVDFTIPCVIECEGYSKQLRKKVFAKSWRNAKVKDILQELIQETDIVLSADIPDISFEGKFILNNEDGCQALERLKNELFLTIYFIDGNILYAGLEQTAQLDKEVNYKLGWNTIKDDQLKYRTNEDAKVRVQIKYKDVKGKTKYKVYGKDGGKEEIVEAGVITDMDVLKKMVNAKARTLTYSGYEGKLTTFLQPYAQHGWKANIDDSVYQERKGAYLVVSVDVLYGARGARRIVELGKSMDRLQDELNES